MNEKYIYSVELYHHGIKGQKWGIRRTKAQLGYKIAEARKKHAANAAVRKKERVAKREEKRAAKNAAKENQKKASKPINEMTLDELKERQNRLKVEHDVWRMEKEIESYKKDIANFTAKEQSFGRKVISAVANKTLLEALPDAAKNATKGFFEKKLKEALGVEGSPRDKKDGNNNQNANKNKQQNNQQKKSSNDNQTNKSNKSDNDGPWDPDIVSSPSGGKSGGTSSQRSSSRQSEPIYTTFTDYDTPASQVTTAMVTRGMDWLQKYGAI